MNLFKRSAVGLFASASLLGHLLRGALATGLLIWAIQNQAQVGLSLLAAAGAIVAFRGCPLCWAIGLFETVTEKLRG